jgi:hypothetical protein
MHPVLTEKLAAERIREMVARGDAARRAGDAHRARHGQRARGRRAAAHRGSAAHRRDAARPAAGWTPGPVNSVRRADGTGR